MSGIDVGKMSLRTHAERGRYNLMSSEEQWLVTMYVTDNDGNRMSSSVVVRADDEPDWVYGHEPEEFIERFEQEKKRCIPYRDEDKAAIEYVKANVDALTMLWYLDIAVQAQKDAATAARRARTSLITMAYIRKEMARP